MTDSNYCTKCRSEVRPFEKYCSKCGHKSLIHSGDDVIVKCARCNGEGSLYYGLLGGTDTCPACKGAGVQRI